ncbi:actin-related protein 5 isoform X2 [Hylaeus anthracinus]|uniref:actin-related protein 5 isoform X2 n=1 Tax=Hylaeus volcanicus TaxID=313075 RepID=UPI0023B7B5AF|nr:actin-related protein 5 isoform X2 [Hylaeus volcanicus]XP_054007349.1 actin-related protein 5 isoform X2 [Hylaeus anthracinus]
MEILELKDVKAIPDVIHTYPDRVKSEGTPLVIDNGSYKCRVGWATEKEPQLIFKNLIAKPRKERGKKDGEPQVGNDIANIEAVRFQLKTQFDRNVVTHFEAQEQIFDYIFTHMGIDTEGAVNHPIILTETFLNPNYSRNLMAELLFECYNVPSIAYGVDCLFSYQHNNCPSDGLIISIGYHTTHIIPILDGKADPVNSRRINVGGYHITSYMHRLLQLKYPVHVNAITPSRAEELIHEHSMIALNYQEEISKWADPDYYDANVLRVQLPYVAPSSAPGLTVEQQKERKRELARRLMEINARKREERLAEDEEQLNQLLAVQDLLEEGETDEFDQALKSYSLANEADLIKMINNLQAKVERTRQKIVAANSQEENIVMEEQKPKIKSSLQPKDQQDFDEWIAGVRKKRQEILEKRMAKRQRRQDMAKRRTAAAQERMRIISQLARKEKRDDDFGMRDEDWDVYKVINREGGDSDSELEQEKLLELEDVLRHHDPEFDGAGSNVPMVPGETHQLHIGVERLRAPEILFQPSLIGSMEAGIAETIEFVLKLYPPEQQLRLVGNIFLTGGPTTFPGLLERLNRELREMRPFDSNFQINIAKNTSIDAWYGARDFGLNGNLPEFLVSKKEYEEKGGEYFKEHSTSNTYTRSPDPLPIIQVPVTSEQIIVEDAVVDVEME